MDNAYILTLISTIVSLVLGQVAKPYIDCLGIDKKKYIPIQNLVVGLIATVGYYIFTKDWSIAIASSGLIAGGTYDLLKNLKALIKED